MDRTKIMCASIVENKKRLKILLIEDDAIIQIVHNCYLEGLGCSVDIAHNGQEALSKINNEYDIIFIDIGLPDILGTEIVKAFRQSSDHKKTMPIIALTGYSSNSNKKEFITSGVDEVIVKPIFLEQFEAILKQYCEEVNLI